MQSFIHCSMLQEDTSSIYWNLASSLLRLDWLFPQPIYVGIGVPTPPTIIEHIGVTCKHVQNEPSSARLACVRLSVELRVVFSSNDLMIHMSSMTASIQLVRKNSWTMWLSVLYSCL